ncbi:hypothetical protein [Deinococcus aquiradiocola]|uniref:Uncharacterized protein n=1 Tax=Deinococcus aquiradiocola TaxID=393059 RepID=A0A917P412_9DEIO|nr:hypothetical protein [Deinococcus aquiradiocola]GGJ60522.1 hypothetical protein GCM10008939_00320 [Deinococcus aquiradiocola]
MQDARPSPSPRSPVGPLALARRAALTAAALLGTAFASPARALTVPMSGWNATDATRTTWADAAGACLLHEETLTQPYPGFSTADAARTFALRVQTALQAQTEGGQKLQSVVTQPVDRAGKWTVLAAYLFVQNDVSYRATQLYVTDSGKLRTITGSSADGEASECVSQMREFLRFLAD